MKPYIQLNTEKRQQTQNMFGEFFKQINNPCYGETLESKEDPVSVRLVFNRDQLIRSTDCAEFCQFKIFDGNVAAISSRIGSFVWKKPTIVAASNLDPAKYHMFQFHYNVKKEHLNCQVLYSDTDSFLYEMKHADLYEELAKNSELRNHFDLSNYPEDHKLHSSRTKWSNSR